MHTKNALGCAHIQVHVRLHFYLGYAMSYSINNGIIKNKSRFMHLCTTFFIIVVGILTLVILRKIISNLFIVIIINFFFCFFFFSFLFFSIYFFFSQCFNIFFFINRGSLRCISRKISRVLFRARRKFNSCRKIISFSVCKSFIRIFRSHLESCHIAFADLTVVHPTGNVTSYYFSLLYIYIHFFSTPIIHFI